MILILETEDFTQSVICKDMEELLTAAPLLHSYSSADCHFS